MNLLSIGAALAILAPPLPAATLGKRASESRSFIVTCACETAAQRARVIAAVRRQGGTLLYEYTALNGVAIAAPKRGSVARFERRLRHIPGVIAVTPDGTSHTMAGSIG